MRLEELPGASLPGLASLPARHLKVQNHRALSFHRESQLTRWAFLR